ncbi:MAG: glycosyltransferase family 2 protein [Bacteroidales bacterium]|jgi:glycosyltransferase involved in cell wall biosynthesis|nr:glycosyltransferase family 2 protein [Bacteroidales bacterium]
MPKITIVTIVFNDRFGIEETIKSVLNQNFEDFEYIVKDGGSTDGTRDIILSYEKNIDFIISGHDAGIYDAMNQAIDVASGEWIIFMNSGDCFISPNTLSLLYSKRSDASVIYGSIFNPETGEEIKPRKLSEFWKGMPFNHQATLTKTILYQKKNFDLKYKISSVYDFYYHYYLNGEKFSYVNIPVAFYDMNGISAYSFKWLDDYWRINMKYSKGMRMKIIFRVFYVFLSRLKSNITRLKKKE